MNPGRIKGPLRNLLLSMLPRIDYFGFYRCQVTNQSADLKTVDVVPDNRELIPLVGQIPLRQGLPGLTVDLRAPLAAGAKMYALFGFIGGDPQQPFIHSWEGGEALGTLMFGGTSLDALLDGLVHGRGQDTFTGLTFGALGVTTPTLRSTRS